MNQLKYILNKSNRVNIALVLSILGGVIGLVAYYPGFMSSDTLDQYEQSLTKNYGDWHPPVMAAWWSVLNIFYRGPQTMLIFQLILYWGGFYILCRTITMQVQKQLLLFIIFLLAPFLQNFLGYIVKDVQMALSWFFAFALIMRAEWQKREMTRIESALSFLLILYGTLVRINALPGALPLVFLWYGNKSGWTRRGPVIMVTILSVFVFILAQATLMGLLRPRKQFAEYKFFMQDISGIYVKNGGDYFPSFIKKHPGFDTAFLKANYTSATMDNLWWSDKIKFAPVDEHNRYEVQNAWANSIMDHPLAYLKNRAEGFMYFLYVNERTPIVYLIDRIDPNNHGLVFKHNAVSNIMLGNVRLQSDMPYMRPWFWLLLNSFLFICCFFVSDRVMRRSLFVLTISSLFYLLPQFFIYQIDTDFRYLYWNCLSMTLAAALVFKEIRSVSANRRTDKQQPHVKTQLQPTNVTV